MVRKVVGRGESWRSPVVCFQCATNTPGDDFLMATRRTKSFHLGKATEPIFKADISLAYHNSCERSPRLETATVYAVQKEGAQNRY